MYGFTISHRPKRRHPVVQDADLVYLMEVVDQYVSLYLIEVVLQGVGLMEFFFLRRLKCFVGLVL